MQRHFGIAARPKTMTALFQFAAQLGVIVNLSVKDNDGVAGGAGHGLIAIIQIYDLEADGAERDTGRLIHAVLIGTAMPERGCDPAN
jgi:hypothetical protein